MCSLKFYLNKISRVRLSVLNTSSDNEEETGIEFDVEEQRDNGVIQTVRKKKNLLVDLPEPEVKVENDKVHVRRPWLRELLLLASNGGLEKLKKKVVLTEEERAERRRRAKEMEIERRKALRAAQRRARLAKKMAAADGKDGNSDQQVSILIST